MTTTSSPRLILVTGAAGNIGKYFAQHANKQKYSLRLMVCVLFLENVYIFFKFSLGTFFKCTRKS
jgi:hypothetical protein